MLLDDNGHLRRVLIGEYIDHKFDVELDNNTIQSPQTDVLYGPNPPRNAIKVLACDSKGKISWRQIEAFTRHPVVNEDGTNDVVRVTTQTGRIVTATLGESFLQRHNNEIVPIRGQDLQVGMELPISKVLPIRETTNVLKVEYYLSKSDFLFQQHFPKIIELDNNFGYFVGVYLTSGACTSDYLMISNDVAEINEKMDIFCQKVHVRYELDEKKLKIHSMILAKLFTKSIGVGESKRIPAEFLGAPDGFLIGLMDGLMSSKTRVNKRLVHARDLLEDIRQLLLRFHISSTIVEEHNHYCLHLTTHEQLQAILSGTEVQSSLFFVKLTS